ncbi:MAG: type IV secretory system conjugative DNA transfer family protein [Proteobacteria bacterium]|nr:type IV secretory system conjugative DNA transfer family protein [Pseudomonadota bacterium]
MDISTPPSVKLAARLAAMGTRWSPPPSRAEKIIATAEGQFSDPTNMVRAAWRKHSQGFFVFSRAAHDFSDYESFVTKLLFMLAGFGRIERTQCEELLASVVYAGGKATLEGNALADDINDYVAVHQLIKNGDKNFVPKPLQDYAEAISNFIRTNRSPDSPEPLRNWINQYVDPDQAEISAGSQLFSETPGPYGLPLGIDPTTNRELFYVGEASLLTIAPPGKGKTQCHVLPTLARYEGPAIVLDIKGECYDHTADWRRRHVGQVIVFDPTRPDQSASYNPLAFVSDEPDELWESARFLSDLLVISRNSMDPTWENQGKDLLTLIIAFVVQTHARGERQMSSVLDFLGTIGLSDMLAFVAEKDNNFPSAMRRVAARFSQMAKVSAKQFEGVLSGASQHMQIWEGPKLERVTSRVDWQPSDFRSTPYPTLYLCVPPNAVETYAPILRIIVAQHVRLLMASASKPQAPILFLLDELPRLGYMEPVRQALEVGRSYGIKLWMIAQYADQLIHAYPGVGEGMMESCDVRMYMNPSASTADRLSKAFGKKKNVFDGSKGPALEPSEIMGPKYRESIFALAANEKPMILRKKYHFHTK